MFPQCTHVTLHYQICSLPCHRLLACSCSLVVIPLTAEAIVFFFPGLPTARWIVTDTASLSHSAAGSCKWKPMPALFPLHSGSEKMQDEIQRLAGATSHKGSTVFRNTNACILVNAELEARVVSHLASR